MGPEEPNLLSDHDAELAAHLGVYSVELSTWSRALGFGYDPQVWGFAVYSIIDERQRALASDLLISSLDGVGSNLIHLALAVRDHQALVGPNGRTMPGPDTTMDERVESVAIERHAADAFRAIGSVLDCLSAAAILTLGIPAPVQRAEGSWLLRQDHGVGGTASEDQADALAAFEEELARHLGRPGGWLAWTLEMRNAVVHRRLIGLWLPHGGRRPGVPQIVVPAAMPLHHLLRMKPHLRRRPWLADMHALGGTDDAAGLWLSEPGPVTLACLRQRILELVNGLCRVLSATWKNVDETWHWPVEQWDLEARDGGTRLEAASAFAGFEPNYKIPPLTSIRMSPRDAKRAALAERLRGVGA